MSARWLQVNEGRKKMAANLDFLRNAKSIQEFTLANKLVMRKIGENWFFVETLRPEVNL